jgi:hypothetical protein
LNLLEKRFEFFAFAWEHRVLTEQERRNQPSKPQSHSSFFHFSIR